MELSAAQPVRRQRRKEGKRKRIQSLAEKCRTRRREDSSAAWARCEDAKFATAREVVIGPAAVAGMRGNPQDAAAEPPEGSNFEATRSHRQPVPPVGLSFGAPRSFFPRHCRRCSCGETRNRIAGEQGASRAGQPAPPEAGPLKGWAASGETQRPTSPAQP
jgi:hypothetical protein